MRTRLVIAAASSALLIWAADFFVLCATKKLVPVALNSAQMIVAGSQQGLILKVRNGERESADYFPQKNQKPIRVGCYASEEFLSSVCFAPKQINPGAALNQPPIERAKVFLFAFAWKHTQIGATALWHKAS